MPIEIMNPLNAPSHLDEDEPRPTAADGSPTTTPGRRLEHHFFSDFYFILISVFSLDLFEY